MTEICIDDQPQFFVDDHLVDNRWGVEYLTEAVIRVFHAPVKHAGNPVIAGRGGYVNVLREGGRFRMWYQDYWDQSWEPRKYTYGVAYAESEDGVDWRLPTIGRHAFKGTKDNNIVLLGPGGGRAEVPYLLDVPEQYRRGYAYLLLYLTDEPESARLIGSHDGINWDPASDICIASGFTPDTHGSIVWDPRRERFVWFTRATNLYRDRGARRKVARLEHARLWQEWPIRSENILLPDRLDAETVHNYFYGMPTRYYAGIYWGFLWPYRHQEDIYTALAFSRDGRHFQRPAERPPLIDLGAEGAWDAGMVMASNWVEVGDEWWIYYAGTGGLHKERDPVPGIGLARLRKEGFASLRSPAGGGFVVTKLLQGPGGRLLLNANASGGELRVRLTDYERAPLPGYGAPSRPISGDGVRQAVQWDGLDAAVPAQRPLRLEFEMRGLVDLYGFCFSAISKPQSK